MRTVLSPCRTLEDTMSPNASERLAILEERVSGHIKFFYSIAGVFALWLGGISLILYQMNGNVNRLALPQRVEQSSLKPTDKTNQDQASALLDQARSSSIQIPETIIQSAGTRFIDAAASNPDAWPTALNFLNYRSSLNVYTRAVNAVPIPPGLEFRFDLGPPVDHQLIPRLSFVQAGVSPADSARLETIGKNLNQGMNLGVAELIVSGGSLSLDNKYLRHVILESVDVYYTGRPLVAEDVLFVNCTFYINNTKPGREFGQRLLASFKVNFMEPS